MDTTAAWTLFAGLDSEVWLLTARAGPRRGGLIATFVHEATIVPEMPRLLVGLAKQHHTHQLVAESGAFAAHLLSVDNLDWVWRFGLRSGRDGDKFDGLTVGHTPLGCPLLDGAVGWLDCQVEARLDGGDRTVFLAEVVASNVGNVRPPLTARRLVELAPPPYREELKRQRQRDSHIDAEAIRAWRDENQTR